MKNRRLLLLPVALVLAANAYPDAFKCKTADGETVISNLPCEDGSKTLAVESSDRITLERQRQAEKEAERQRKRLAEHEAARAAEQEREQESRRKLAEEESARQTQCIEDAQKEPEPQFRADLIAACKGVPPQRPIVIQQPVPVPPPRSRITAGPIRQCASLECKPLSEERPEVYSPPMEQSKKTCRPVGGILRCD